MLNTLYHVIEGAPITHLDGKGITTKWRDDRNISAATKQNHFAVHLLLFGSHGMEVTSMKE